MPEFDYDLCVVGGGSGGVRAARVAAQKGARVIIAEEYRYGGTCVIRGCVPKKLLVYASEFSHSFSDAGGFGWTVDGLAFDWPTLIRNKDREIDRLNSIYIDMLKRAGAEVVQGRATLLDSHTLSLDGRPVTAKFILLATGARPVPLGAPGEELAISSNEAFHLPTLPARMVVVGGGYIGVEFAHIFAGLGVNVGLVHHRDTVLRGFDEDIRAAVTEGLRHHKVDLYLDDEVKEVTRLPSGELNVHLRSGKIVPTDVIMGAVGRAPNTSNIGLEEAGVQLNRRGAVIVDKYSQSSVAHIYAVGDCTDRVNLTPVAIREGQAFVDTVFDGHPSAIDHDGIPTAVFSQPQVGTVGLSESTARERFGSVDIYKTSFRPLKHALTGRHEKVLMKLVVAADTQRVVGVHIVGDGAAEMIQCVAIAVRMGATKADFDNTMAVHPTSAEELVLLRQKAV